jgi:hypothetical protein
MLIGANFEWVGHVIWLLRLLCFSSEAESGQFSRGAIPIHSEK